MGYSRLYCEQTWQISGLSIRNISTSFVRQSVSSKEHVNGVDIHYEKTGEGQHPILLLPGALGCGRTDFEHQIKGLSTNKYTIIAMDPRGCGESRPPDRDWPVNFLQRDAEDAAALMKALSYPRYSVLGWSDGANSSMILAAANPGNIISLVIWGGNSYVSEHDMQLYKAIENLDNWSPRMKQPFVDVYGEDYFKKMWAGWQEVQQEIFNKRNGDICIGSLPNIKCSTLLVNGVKDALVPQDQPLFLQKHIVNCR
ncbi:valacyclovir hydrolase [Elysia marginata]|uniref:Valacyclovir hydrolase n=1 Tax=Elysia marginata TaxID=1093978 RepID=A0AAV4F4W7_9GAST|nr:valacyclovir hydrolase [Elysia marginata]